MLCPFCLGQVRFKQEKATGTRWSVYVCPLCNEQIPALYSLDYRKFPPVVVNAVGFRQHGKTVYFATMFYALKKLKLAVHWPRFFTMGLNEDSLDTVYRNVSMLEDGALPASTPKNFPRPTMIRVNGIPMQPDCTLLCYDTGGECFERPTGLVQFAGFVRRARTAMLLVSIPDLKNPPTEMHQLLNTYVVGMGELNGGTQDQHLVVVYTKADRVAEQLDNHWGDIREYLSQGSVDGLAQPDQYIAHMHDISGRLHSFTRSELKADEFLNAAHANFKSVTFSAVSALGAHPDSEKLSVGILPRRILDPLFWMMEKSLPGWRQWVRHLRL